jgi:hypothetical protein
MRLAQSVAIAIPDLVEPGAGADLQQAERPAEATGDFEKAAEQHARPAYLVGLRRRCQICRNQGRFGRERRRRCGPEVFGLNVAVWRITGSERRRATGKHQRMERAGKAQRQRVRHRIAGPIADQPHERSVC